MKITKKALFSLLCALFCVVIFACASSGGGGKAAASGAIETVAAVFTVEPNDDSNDNGSSTMIMTVADEVIDGVTYKTYKFKGTITDKIRYGVCDASLTPDEETLARMKVATAISFKMLTTDGKTYNVEAPISTVQDWGFHRYTVKTEANVVQDVKIEMRMFMQPAWATAVKFSQSRLTKFRIQTLNAAEGGLGPYEFKVWDFKITGPTPAGFTPSSGSTASTAPAASATPTASATPAASSASANDKAPNFGTPTPFQQALNLVSQKLPINIAGKQVTISFEGGYWRGKVNGADLLAGECTIVEDGNGGALITLKQSWLYADTGKKVPLTNKPLATWVKTPGPDITIDYGKGPPAKFAIK